MGPPPSMVPPPSEPGPASSPIGPRPQKSASPPRAEDLFDTLRARILGGEWPPGTRLPPERDLAASLDTNRNTLREVIRRLEAGRLVTTRQGRGVTVLDFRRTASCELVGPFLREGESAAEKARFVLDMLLPRARLTELSVELAAARATAEDLAHMDEVLARCREAERDGAPRALAEAQVAWGEALVDAAHNVPARWLANPYLEAMADMLLSQPGFIIFEPSFADQAAGIRAAIADRDARTAIAITRRYHEDVDVQVRQALAPLAAPPEG